MVPPVGSGGSGGDGDASLSLLRHPVHGRSALVDSAYLADPPRQKEDPFSNRGLPGIDVRDEADITDFTYWKYFIHKR
jgi:hypothetical protein